MKALSIAPQPFFSPRGTPLSVYYRSLILSELGVEVDLVTYGQGSDVDIPGLRIRRIPNFKFLGAVKTGPSMLKLFLDVFVFFTTLWLLIVEDYDFVLAHEESVFFCTFLKPFFRFKLVYDMHSSLPQQLSNFQYDKYPMWIKLFNFLEEASLKASDAVITICPDLHNYAKKRLAKDQKLMLIENSLFEPVRIVLTRKTARQTPQKVEPLPMDAQDQAQLVVYAGTLESYQGIDILIRSFALVVQKQHDARLLIVGGTAEQVAFYSRLTENLGISQYVTFTGRVSQIQAQRYSHKASVLVSPRSKGTNTPLKIYEQLASGIPLVATNIYSHVQVLTPDVAFLVDPDPAAMAQGILSALDSKGEAAAKTANARNLYRSAYSRTIYKDKIRRLLNFLSSFTSNHNTQNE